MSDLVKRGRIKRDLTLSVLAITVPYMSTTRTRTPFARNNTTHVEVRFTDGEVFGEKHRDSFGGFLNMVRRVETRIGATEAARSREVNGEIVFTAAGREFTFVEVSVL